MAATLAATFTFIRCVRESLYVLRYLKSVICVGPNCEREVKNSQNLYAVSLREYDTTVGHVLCVISCICMLFLNNSW